MELFLVRHGQTLANEQKIFQGWIDYSLTGQGRAEAWHLSDLLKEVKFDGIYSSPLKRAIETATIICESWTNPVPITRVDALKEMNFGRWDGLRTEEISQQNPVEYREWLADWQSKVVPDGESAELLYGRVTEWIKDLLEKESADAKILVVTHEGVILQMISYLVGIGLAGCWHFRVHPGSLSVIEIHDGFAVLTRLNQR